MNIMNNYLCARIRRRASGHSGPFQGQPLQGQVWIPRFSKVRNKNLLVLSRRFPHPPLQETTRSGAVLQRSYDS